MLIQGNAAVKNQKKEVIILNLTDEEYERLNESLKILQEIFKSSMSEYSETDAKGVDNEFIKMIGEKYLSPSGLIDLLQDYDIMTKQKCPCANPCTVSCVAACASACYKGAEHPEDVPQLPNEDTN